MTTIRIVSIPFKRESVFKVLWHIFLLEETMKVSIPFKRESVFKGFKSILLKRGKLVSIPFKRESVFKVKRSWALPTVKAKVSIPFKRESVFKGLREKNRSQSWKRFNSLQTGKCIQSDDDDDGEVMALSQFQFPSNGKVYSKLLEWCIPGNRMESRFQFPSNGKVYSKPSESGGVYNSETSFNSLQTGKCIQRRRREKMLMTRTIGFQFPSNGKVYSK